MLSHEFKCIYIHQRKTGGNSIKHTFGMDLHDADYIKFNDGVASEGEIGAWHEKVEKYNDYFVFSAVRNPWEKFISAWKYCETTKNRTLLDVLENPPKQYTKKHPEERHDYRHLMRPQSDLLLDNQGELVVDFLIRFETLQQDFDEVCRLIGKPPVELLTTNKTEHDDYRSYSDEHTRDLVAKLFELEVAPVL
jgi:chondroitin 4-sulfotransferase 11